MAIILGTNQYGKAENRVVRIYRDTPRHEIHDIFVSSALRGDFSAAHLVGDQSSVLPTDTQKQTAYAYAKEKGLKHIEDYALALALAPAQHYVNDVEAVQGARIEVEEFLWERALVDGQEHNHTFIRKGQEVRLAAVTIEGKGDAQQQTLFEMGKGVLETYDIIAEVQLFAPNKHHFVYDLAPFGLENNNEVFNADDRPYGLIQATVTRDDAPDAGPSWRSYTGLV